MFCNSRLPRSQVDYFTEVSIIVFLIVVSLTKFDFSTAIVKSQQFGFHCYRAQLDIHFQIISYE